MIAAPRIQSARSDYHHGHHLQTPYFNRLFLSIPLHPLSVAMSQLLLQNTDMRSSSDDEPELTYINVAIALSFIVVDSSLLESHFVDGSHIFCCTWIGNREICSCCFGTMFNSVICDGTLHRFLVSILLCCLMRGEVVLFGQLRRVLSLESY